MLGGQQHRQRFEPDEDAIDGRHRMRIEPVDPSEDDIEAAGREAFERGPGPAGVATAEVDRRRSQARQVEDPGRREPSVAHEVDHGRLRGGYVDVRPDRVVARNEVSGHYEQPLSIRRQRDPTGRSEEQRRAQSRLEPLDLATERLLGNEQARRGAGEVELLCRRHEVAERADLELVADRPAGSIHALLMVIRHRQVLDARGRLSEGMSHEVLTQDADHKENREHVRSRSDGDPHHRAQHSSRTTASLCVARLPLHAASAPSAPLSHAASAEEPICSSRRRSASSRRSSRRTQGPGRPPRAGDLPRMALSSSVR